MGKHFAGGKITSSHTSAIDVAESIIRAAERSPEVSKIVLGVITTGIKSSQRNLKFLPINGGWKVAVRGSRSIQDLYIYTRDPERTKTVLSEAFR